MKYPLLHTLLLILLTGIVDLHAQEPDSTPPGSTAQGANPSVETNDTAALGEQGGVRGVNPADNLTKFEILPKFTSVDSDHDISVSTLTLKYDRAIAGRFGVNLELPLANFDSPFQKETGVGDLNLRLRVQSRISKWTFIGGLETVFPTASDNLLGSGKYQLNPTLAAVHAFSKSTFGVLAAKQFFSVAGDPDKPDIRGGQYRVIFARTTQRGWWFLADAQFWVDYSNGVRMEFFPEVEIGKMIGKTTGVWVRGGAHAAGDWDRNSWTVGAGVRLISF